jgi:NAD(P)-dependent dehydrogenase (short-subunit alcohol dehydrogenase family)
MSAHRPDRESGARGVPHEGTLDMAGKLSGKVAVVAGGSANIGKLFAEALADDGADVVVHYNSKRRADEADVVVKDLESRGVRAFAHQSDLTSNAEITRLVDTAIERFGSWDILVNTAGLIIRKPLAETTEEDYDRSFAINAKIPYFFMAEAANKMADNGRIVNMVTTQVAVTAATYSAYAGSKAPVEHFTKAFSKEIGPRGVTVNCIAPGPQKTPFFFDAETPETIAWLSGMTISGELGDPADVVPVMRFLVSPETRWVTAQTIYVNGGMISPIN